VAATGCESCVARTWQSRRESEPSMNRAIKVKFRLYVTGGTENSLQALSNLTALCRRHLENRHEIEIVDVFLEPGRALEDRIFMTPTLVKLSPEPLRRIIGTLSQTQSITQALGLGIFEI
jgi:circadian clock protein KaiB